MLLKINCIKQNREARPGMNSPPKKYKVHLKDLAKQLNLDENTEQLAAARIEAFLTKEESKVKP